MSLYHRRGNEKIRWAEHLYGFCAASKHSELLEYEGSLHEWRGVGHHEPKQLSVATALRTSFR